MKIFDTLVKLAADESVFRGAGKTGGKDLKASDLGQVLRDHFQTFTIYNPAALVSFAVFAATLFHPWWKAVVHHDTYLIQAFAFVLQHNLPFDMGTDFIIETPRPAVIFFLCLFVFYALLVLWGGTMKGNKGRTFVALAGLCMMLYTAGFYGAIWYATDRIDVPVTGFALVIFEVQVDVFMNFERSYFVAIGAGAACLLSSLFHGFPTLRLHRKKGASRNDV